MERGSFTKKTCYSLMKLPLITESCSVFSVLKSCSGWDANECNAAAGCNSDSTWILKKKTFKCLPGKAGDYILDNTFVYHRYTLSVTK